MKESRADAGIGYDGDADRIGVVDEQGNILWGDQLMILFAREILNERKGGHLRGRGKMLSESLSMTSKSTEGKPSCGRQAIPSSRKR